MHYTYYYNTILYLADGSNVLFDSQIQGRQLNEHEINQMLNDCINECFTKPYLQLHHTIVITSHIVKINIEWHEDSYY